MVFLKKPTYLMMQSVRSANLVLLNREFELKLKVMAFMATVMRFYPSLLSKT